MVRGITDSLVNLRGCAFLRAEGGDLRPEFFHNEKNPAAADVRSRCSRRAEASSRTSTDGAAATASGPIRVWIFGATGFRQGLDNSTGLELLWRKLRRLSRPDVCVTTPQPWNDDPEAMADYIARNSAPGAVVFFYGYSYGVGNYFLALAKALQGHGMTIDTAVLCDGIRRFRVGKWFSLRAFRDLVEIEVPANVEMVYAFHQREDRWLHGHLVTAVDPTLTEVEMIELHGYDHASIDEAGSFHRVAIKEAEDVIHTKLGYHG
jgi:hypothetical protein